MTGTLYVVDSNEHIVVYIRVNEIRRMYTVLNFLATFNHESDAWYQGYYNTTDSELLEDLAPISVEDEDDLINLARINTILLKYVGTNFDITTEDPKAILTCAAELIAAHQNVAVDCLKITLRDPWNKDGLLTLNRRRYNDLISGDNVMIFELEDDSDYYDDDLDNHEDDELEDDLDNHEEELEL